MEIRRLSYFVRIAEDGSLTKASGVLRIAQPALSRQIRLLESELGVSLFSRTARGMQLTAEGDHLRAAVTGPLRELELALQSIRSFPSRIEGNFAIGLPSNIGDMLAGNIVRQMNAELPNIKLRIVEGPTGSLVDWLNRGVIDFALIEGPSRDDRLLDRPLLSETLMLVGAPSAALRPDQSVSMKEIARLPLILPSHHMGLRELINNEAVKARVTLTIQFEADSIKLIQELVADGMGYSLLPPSYFNRAHREGRLTCCPIAQSTAELTIFLCRRKHNQIGNMIEKFLKNIVRTNIEMMTSAHPDG